ncbi:MAG TPA: NPCBM/NEW2 domain-containing protein [Nocardioides sp.]|nr:NPCBM/NEW2 domain-containing protein [Nocardioides sp.]
MGLRTRLLTAGLALGLIGGPGLTAPAGNAAPARQVTVSISITKPVILQGQKTVVRGALKPRKAGAPVALRLKVTGGWKTIQKKRTTSRGTYTFTVAPQKGGVFTYRVTRQPIRGAGQVHSRTVQLTVYRWRNVNDLDITEYDGVTDFDGPAIMDGTTYARSIVLDADATEEDPDEPGFFVVDVHGTCALFETTVGGLDDNTAETQVRAEVTGDDEVLSDETYGVGEVAPLTLDIRGYSEVRVDTVAVEQDVHRGLGVGSPRMLCAS